MSLKVSICIPCYEQLDYLKLTLDSVLKQTYLDYEVIVSDDSISNTVSNYIDEISGAFHGKLQYFRNRPPKGSPDNWNFAMRWATGDLIHLLHHDDYYTNPQALSNMVSSFQESPVSQIFVGGLTGVDANTGKISSLTLSQSDFERLKKSPVEIFFANIIGPPSNLVFRAECRKDFDRNLKWLVDMEFYYRLLEKCGKWVIPGHPFITSISNASNNVTQFCDSNPAVEVMEFLFVYNKHIRKRFLSIRWINIFRVRIIRKYGLFELADFKKYSGQQRIPAFIWILIKLEKYKYVFTNKK